jgi:hypothetical protein
MPGDVGSMHPILSLEEIERRFSGEWVLLADIESDPGPVFRRGRVIWHSADQDECWAKAAETTASGIGVLYVGDWSADTEPVPIL